MADEIIYEHAKLLDLTPVQIGAQVCLLLQRFWPNAEALKEADHQRKKESKILADHAAQLREMGLVELAGKVEALI